MSVSNALWPTPEQFDRIASLKRDGPIAMLNLLKFKPRAEYGDGRATDLTGAEAYAVYAEELTPLFKEAGARLVFKGAVDALVIGEGAGDWDQALIVEYPSQEAFAKMTSSEAYLEAAVHRKAGLEGQLLVAIDPQS